MSPLAAGPRSWPSAADCDLDAFRSLVERTTEAVDHPHADAVEQGVLFYDSDRLRAAADHELPDIQAELMHAWADGPGVVVFRRASPDPAVLDRATAVVEEVIAEQRASGAAAGDHFAKPGAGDRVGNALEETALKDPGPFADYYANEILALAAPGVLRRPPRTAAAGQGRRGVLRPGAVPRRRGQPFGGYRADGQPAPGVVALRARDGERGPRGRGERGVPGARRAPGRGRGRRLAARVVAASAAGHPFPTSLDLDQPVDGMAPPSQADLVHRALRENWTADALRTALRSGAERRTSRKAND
ncbi:hypothetical protein OK074_1468 [Actinobacteria bacterium OK074]|nr:hypothetical protein OK074_1468 [Actinobacteria bacterium OK074]